MRLHTNVYGNWRWELIHYRPADLCDGLLAQRGRRQVDEETKPKRKAKDNPWYRLATFHGEPASADDEVAAKNRVTWNRWMASRIPDDLKAVLLEKGHTPEELKSLSEDEFQKIGSQLGISAEAEIDFSDTEFESLFAHKFIFPPGTSFAVATFSGNADFSSAKFSGAAFFKSAKFSGLANFRSAELSGGASFSSAKFSHDASFVGATFGSATFGGDADFSSAIFIYRADFESAKFSGLANFRSAEFGDAYFDSATFSGAADFNSAKFNGGASFDIATFSGDTDFSSAEFTLPTTLRSATFSGAADFNSAIFIHRADFGSATFSGLANFGSAKFRDNTDFTNATMESVTIFSKVTFARPPAFFGAKLHEGTTWHDVTWPLPPEDREQAAAYVEAYERLKLEMDKLRKYGDELDFFARELQCRRVLLGPWKGLPFAIYGFSSGYGRSYMRPLLLLVQTVLIGAIPLLVVPLRIANTRVFQRSSAAEAIGISFASTLSILGKPLIEADVLLGLPNWLKAIATLQSILGIAFLFLFGLGIRNRFRMK
jgi:uncharacterized protein YjbI with pentapeptide repeats